MVDVDACKAQVLSMEERVRSGEYAGFKARLVTFLCGMGRWALRTRGVVMPNKAIVAVVREPRISPEVQEGRLEGPSDAFPPNG